MGDGRAVTGRRQHAKAAVLKIRRGQRTRTRAVVTSANLTGGGLRTNVELAVWDERGGGSQPFIAVDLIGEISNLAKGLAPDIPLDTALRALAGPLRGRPRTRRTAVFAHSERSAVRHAWRQGQAGRPCRCRVTRLRWRYSTSKRPRRSPAGATSTPRSIYVGYEGGPRLPLRPGRPGWSYRPACAAVCDKPPAR